MKTEMIAYWLMALCAALALKLTRVKFKSAIYPSLLWSITNKQWKAVFHGTFHECTLLLYFLKLRRVQPCLFLSSVVGSQSPSTTKPPDINPKMKTPKQLVTVWLNIKIVMRKCISDDNSFFQQTFTLQLVVLCTFYHHIWFGWTVSVHLQRCRKS